MLTSTSLSFLNLIMERVQHLEPTLLAFWEGFPCPPPWNEDLLFRLNWTGCVGLEVGERVKLFMADKCHIRHDGKKVVPELGQEDGFLVEEECALTCQLIIGVVSVLFLVLLFIIVGLCVKRHRAKPASPSHQSSLTANPDNTKYYTSCHYACAPVVARQLQTTLNGHRTETSVLPAGAKQTNGHYQPGTYPQHNCQKIGYHRHLPQAARLINTPYGQVPAHTSSLIVPPAARYGPSHYRKLDGAYSSSSISNSDRSPVYESIGDTDSLREHGRASMSECEFCECGADHNGDQGGYAGYQEAATRAYHDAACAYSPLTDHEPPGPCPPMFMDGYYGDKCPQTLPLRPLRGQSRRDGGSSSEMEPDEISPLKRKNSSKQTEHDGDGKTEASIRRRPSCGSCHFSNGQRRVIPALHPHYFVASPDEIS